MTRKLGRKFGLRLLLFLTVLSLFFIFSFSFPLPTIAEEGDGTSLEKGLLKPASANSGGGTILPDLFTGTMSYSIPIEVPPGRKGLTPGLALTYRSSNGNGLLGVGWELAIGAIERKIPVDYAADNYVYRMAGGSGDLFQIPNGEYRAKIEGGFTRYKKIGDAWEATDKSGTRYLFGQTADTRQDGLLGGVAVIFRWCLDQVIDTNGNSISFFYIKDQGQIYLDRIEYTSGSTMVVKLYWESRPDAPVRYTTHFAVTTAKRLRAIDIGTASNHIRAYQLSYTYNDGTSRSLLSSVQQFDKDSTVASDGTVTGIALPPITLGTQGISTGFIDDQAKWVNNSGTEYAGYASQPGRMRNADVEGDGKSDIILGPDSSGNWHVLRSTGVTFYDDPAWALTNIYGNWADKTDRIRNADVDGDGRSDIVIGPDNLGKWYVIRSTGTSFEDLQDTWTPNGTPYTGWTAASNRIWNVDVTGDGKADIVLGPDGAGKWYVLKSLGNSFEDKGAWITGSFAYWDDKPTRIRVGDVTGDGKADFVIGPDDRAGKEGNWYVLRSTGTAFVDEGLWISGVHSDFKNYSSDLIRMSDVNGDGHADVVLGPVPTLGPVTDWGNWYVMRSTGTSFIDEEWISGKYTVWGASTNSRRIRNVDINGDGKSDILIGPDANGKWYVMRSTGSSFVDDTAWVTGKYPTWDDPDAVSRIRMADVDGDGKTDIVLGPDASVGNEGKWYVMRPNPGIPDLLTSISNGLGGTTTITYAASTQDTNAQLPSGNPPPPPPVAQNSNDTQLPFPVQTVSMVTGNDGNGNNTTTQYAYSGGFYHFGERDFRGFNYVKVTGAAGTNGEQTVTETWFHQGNDIDIDINTPNVTVGYMKGKPYRVKVKDGSNNLFSGVTTTYAWDETAPYFNPPRQMDTSTCDGDACARQTRVVYAWYDDYGNVTREDQYGDLSDPNDDRTIRREFAFNPDLWIVGLPRYESIYEGIGTANKVADADFYYDGVSNCSTASANQIPTQGHITRVVRWLNGGASPETRMAYDGYGNLVCTRDANGNTTTVSYDGSFTFPKTVTNPLGHQTTTQYYGVDGVAPGNGLYGEVKSVTDPNGNTTTTQYDTFGRQTLVTPPNGSWSSTAYNGFGTVGFQHVRTNNASGLWSERYFDGVGRTIREKNAGPDGKSIRVDTTYDTRGQVRQTSLPYFDGLETARYQTFSYDPVGRVARVDNPDGTRTLSCYNEGVKVFIDAKNHRKRETRDVYNGLIRVDEYTGTFNPCDTTVGTPYATTTYQYDVLGNLRFVTDAKGNQTEMRYDTLSRKTYMHDPDMGTWTYQYDAAGNLIQQIDAKGQAIAFGYDALNRLKTKISGLPDLTVTDLAGGSTAQVGNPYSVTDTVANNGPSTGTGFVVAYYLSTDTVIDSVNDTWIGSRWVDTLGAGASSTATTTFTMPSWVSAGTYYLGAFADDGTAVTEANESNNTRVTPGMVTVQAPVGADLEVTTLSGSTTAQVGVPYSVTDTVVNSGSNTTGSGFVVAYYLSTDTVIDGVNDTWIGSRWVDTLAAGAGSTATTTFTMPSWVSAGTYYLGAFADDGADIAEANENNNTRVAANTVQVTVAPDLVLTALSGGTSAQIGAPYTVTDTVANNGATPTGGGFLVAYYLSTDTIIDEVNDTWIGYRWVDALGAGASSTATTTFNMPSWANAGTYYLGAIADDGADVPETDENNNTRTMTEMVTVNP